MSLKDKILSILTSVAIIFSLSGCNLKKNKEFFEDNNLIKTLSFTEKVMNDNEAFIIKSDDGNIQEDSFEEEYKLSGANDSTQYYIQKLNNLIVADLNFDYDNEELNEIIKNIEEPSEQNSENSENSEEYESFIYNRIKYYLEHDIKINSNGLYYYNDHSKIFISKVSSDTIIESTSLNDCYYSKSYSKYHMNFDLHDKANNIDLELMFNSLDPNFYIKNNEGNLKFTAKYHLNGEEIKIARELVINKTTSFDKIIDLIYNASEKTTIDEILKILDSVSHDIFYPINLNNYNDANILIYNYLNANGITEITDDTYEDIINNLTYNHTLELVPLVEVFLKKDLNNNKAFNYHGFNEVKSENKTLNETIIVNNNNYNKSYVDYIKRTSKSLKVNSGVIDLNFKDQDIIINLSLDLDNLIISYINETNHNENKKTIDLDNPVIEDFLDLINRFDENTNITMILNVVNKIDLIKDQQRVLEK